MILLLTPFSLTLAGSTPNASDAGFIPTRLPAGHLATSSVWTGSHAYIIGGDYQWSHSIYRFDPTDESVTTMSAAWPHDVAYLGAAWDGEHVYTFGGATRSGSIDSILRYTPADGSIVQMGSKLPNRTYSVSAFWTGNEFVILGGLGPTNEIHHYDPIADLLTRSKASLPSPRGAMAGIWDGQYIYLFGGLGPNPNGPIDSGPHYDDILRYDPLTESIVSMDSKLPINTRGSSAVWSGQHAYVFGSMNGTATGAIMRYAPATDAAALLATQLPTPFFAGSAEWTGSAAYIFAGYTNVVGTDRIVRFTPPQIAGQPAELSATQLSMHEANLTWSPPTDTGASPVVAYRIYAGVNGSRPGLLAEVSGAARAHLHTGIPAGASVRWEIAAVNAEGEGDRASATLKFATAPPSEPTDLDAVAGPGAGDITLTWDPPADTGGTDHLTYIITAASNASGPYAELATATAQEYTEHDLGPGHTRFYRVSAQNALGTGPASRANATTFSPPSEPENLAAAMGNSPQEVLLAWERPQEDGGTSVTRYHIERAALPDGPFDHVGSTVDLAYVDVSPDPLPKFYRVRAENLAGFGPWTPAVVGVPALQLGVSHTPVRTPN